MLLKIYLGISILTLVLYILQNFSLMNRVKQKYADKIKEKTKNKDISGVIFSWLKLVIISFIPIYNVLLLIAIIFMTDKITSENEEKVKEALYNED